MWLEKAVARTAAILLWPGSSQGQIRRRLTPVESIPRTNEWEEKSASRTCFPIWLLSVREFTRTIEAAKGRSVRDGHGDNYRNNGRLAQRMERIRGCNLPQPGGKQPHSQRRDQAPAGSH